jgi:hypothetical protein
MLLAPARQAPPQPRQGVRAANPRAGRELAATSALIAELALTCAVAAGVVVHLTAAGWARRETGLTFRGLLARDVAEWLSLWFWNLRHLAAPLLTAGLVALRDPDLRPWLRRVMGAFEGACGVFVLFEVATNIAYIALAFGGYGLRTAAWLAPHGPLELAAYALALGIWAQTLRRRLPPALAARAGLLSVVLLAAAAAIEVTCR